MKKIIGTFLGTGADLYLGLGGVPLWVRLTNIQSASDAAILTWNRKLSGLVAAKGGHRLTFGASSVASAVYSNLLGIEPYEGETVAPGTTAYQGLVSEVTGIDPANPTGDTSLGGDLRNRGTLGEITDWTLDNGTTQKGHFNAGVNTTLVGIGSLVAIENPVTHREKIAYITGLSNDGDVASEVTLDRNVGTGKVRILRYKYDFGTVPVGYIMQAGIIVHDTALNVSGELVQIEAELE